MSDYVELLARCDELEAENARLIEDVKTGNAILAADTVRQYQAENEALKDSIESIAITAGMPASDTWGVLDILVHVREMREERDTLEAKCARLEWQPITPENLPKVGDEVLRGRCGVSGSVYLVTESVVFSDTNIEDYKALRCTHFRPINQPTLSPAVPPSLPAQPRGLRADGAT